MYISDFDYRISILRGDDNGQFMAPASFSAGSGPYDLAAAVQTAAVGPSADELLRFSGIAPVIERSGKQFGIRWRYFCPKFFRQTFHEFAAQSIQDSFWARAYYYSRGPKAKSITPLSAPSNGSG